MITLAQMAVIASMAGAVAAGLIWFLWDLGANLAAIVAHRAASKPAPAPKESEVPEPERGPGPGAKAGGRR